MKTLNHYKIENNFTGSILRKQELKKLQNTKFDTTKLLYKNTIKKFKKETGINLADADLVKIENNFIFKLYHFKYEYKGIIRENCEYIPLYSLD